MAAKTFDQILSDKQDAKRESDLGNLATALIHAKQQEREAIDLQNRIKTLVAEIEKGRIVSVDDVSNLYDEAMGRPARRKPL